MMMHEPALRNGAAFPVARFTVERQESVEEKLPVQLTSSERYQAADAINPTKPWQIVITNRMMTWLLNGRIFRDGGSRAG